jgi:hypothetical protein
MRPAPASPSPKSPQDWHHTASTHAKAPPGTRPRAFRCRHVLTASDVDFLILGDRAQPARRQTLSEPAANLQRSVPSRGAQGAE